MDREDEAWAAVTARWEDDQTHRAYLSAHSDLDGLAEAGRRYRAALERAPADAVAVRWRDEVVRRAAAIALAQLPRTQPPRTNPLLRRILVSVVVTVMLSVLAWALMRFGATRDAVLP